MFLHLCVIRFTGGGSVSGGSASRGWGLHPGGSASRGRVCIRGVPIGGGLHPGKFNSPPPHQILRDTVNERAVRILLEYILVYK